MFLRLLSENPLIFWCWVFTLVVSVCLHELAHGWAAIRLGDDTPIHTGHMTLNPLVHMGPVSLVALFLVGLAWGAMPVDPSRLRGKYAYAKVCAAGPLMNLWLAVFALLLLGLLQRFFDGFREPDHYALTNAATLLWVFGLVNIVLCLFNLLPVPPMDGSRILAEFHRGYARWLEDNPWSMFLLFPLAFFAAPYLFFWVGDVAGFVLSIVRGY